VIEAVESSKTYVVFYQTLWRQSSKMNVIYLSSKILRKLSGKNRQLFCSCGSEDKTGVQTIMNWHSTGDTHLGVTLFGHLW